jgi:hypothetical protein
MGQWRHSCSGNAEEGISWIEDGIRDFRANRTILGVPFWLALKAEALYLANRTPEALAAIEEAEELVERNEQRVYSARLHQLRGVFLAAIGADETQIESSFRAAISTAKEQKSGSLAKQAEASYAEYRRQKAIAPGRREFQLPLW